MRRYIKPSVEGMEARQMLSTVPGSQVHLAQTGGSAGDASGTGQGGTESTPNQFLDPTGEPTRHESRRQAARFVFDGKFVQGPGRHTDEATQVLIKGIGSSNFFLHGDLQLGAVVPTDASRPTSGAATSFDRNTNSNSSFGIDLIGSTADVDRAGRPTKFTFTIDKNLSGGVFGQARAPGP